MRFDQVKITAENPERLARFYEEALDAKTVLPLSVLNPEASRGVGIPDAEVSILVLELSDNEDAPTLELISISGASSGWDHRPGQGQLAFRVDDVHQAAQRVVTAGGSFQGEIVDFTGPSGRESRFVFMADPEGNIVDLWTGID
ncbi:MAG: VOC family protein [Acidimicrobiia bacterium]